MKKTMQIKSIIVRNQAIDYVRDIPLDDLHEVIIRPYKKDRSLLQNAYYWVILTIIGKDLGYTKNELHRLYKGQFLVPIMLKHPKDYPDFCEMVAVIGELSNSDKIKEAEILSKKVICLVTTTKLKIAHMAEYITDIKNENIEIRFPAPEYD